MATGWLSAADAGVKKGAEGLSFWGTNPQLSVMFQASEEGVVNLCMMLTEVFISPMANNSEYGSVVEDVVMW
jgi:hypothetical protein